MSTSLRSDLISKENILSRKVTSEGLVEVYQSFGETYCFQLQGQRVS